MKATDIMHPEDQKAIMMLRKIPFVDKACRAIMEFAYENIYRGENLATMVRVDKTYMRGLYDDLETIAEIVGVDMPELFIYNDSVMNAFTFGETNPFICVSSSLIEKMDRAERMAILAHECGHILCKHVLYGSVVETLRILGEDFGIIGYTLSGPIRLALQYWSRRSEYSADRCAAAVMGERVFQQSMLKLTLGLADSGDDPYRLVRQARIYHAHENQDIWNRIQQNCRMAFFSHPQNVNRAYEIDRWKNSYAYKKLRKAIEAYE